MTKPIKVFWNPMSQKFYASRSYKQSGPGIVVITGQKFDVTQDIADAIIRCNIEFTPVLPEQTEEWCDGCDGTGLMEGWNSRDGFSCPKCKGEAKLPKGK